jgi:hypothetical protein
MRQLKTFQEINEVQPKILKVLEDDDSGNTIFICKGDMFFFVGVTYRGYESGDEEVGISADALDDLHPRKAFEIGLITQKELMEWEKQVAEEAKSQAEWKEKMEYQKFLRLKAKYETTAEQRAANDAGDRR